LKPLKAFKALKIDKPQAHERAYQNDLQACNPVWFPSWSWSPRDFPSRFTASTNWTSWTPWTAFGGHSSAPWITDPAGRQKV